MRLRSILASLALSGIAPMLAAQQPISGESPDTRHEPGEAKVVARLAPLGGSGITVPAEMRTRMGNSNNRHGVGSANLRYQQIFVGTDFGSQPITIQGHAYRAPRTTSGRNGGSQTLTIKMSPTTKSPASMSTTYATNITGTETTVFSGTVNYPSLSGYNSDPTLFDVEIKWTKPWVFTPKPGQNVLMEIDNTSTTTLGYYMDASGDVSTARLYAGGATATTGTKSDNYGLVVCFLTKVGATKGSWRSLGSACDGTGGAPGVVVPAEMRTEMGTTSNRHGIGTGDMRYQQVFDGTEIGGARVFTSHSYRAPVATYGRPGGVRDFDVLLGETTSTPTSMSSTFATNATGPQTTVFSGTVNLPNLTGYNMDPFAFAVEIKYTRPFAWAGKNNLLLEVVAKSPTHLFYYMDAQTAINTSRLYANGATATSGTVSTNYGLIMRFNYAGSAQNAPVMYPIGRPILGTSFVVNLGNAPANTGAALIFGASTTSWNTIPLPLDLSPLGAKGCRLYVSFDAAFPTLVDAKGQSTMALPIPGDNALLNSGLNLQFLVLDNGANSLGLTLTNAGTGKIGER